jgi:hypothetical protein
VKREFQNSLQRETLNRYNGCVLSLTPCDPDSAL